MASSWLACRPPQSLASSAVAKPSRLRCQTCSWQPGSTRQAGRGSHAALGLGALQATPCIGQLLPWQLAARSRRQPGSRGCRTGLLGLGIQHGSKGLHLKKAGKKGDPSAFQLGSTGQAMEAAKLCMKLLAAVSLGE